MNDPLFQTQGYDLMSAVLEVHREQGGELLEEIYQKSLENELSTRGITFSVKEEFAVLYK